MGTVFTDDFTRPNEFPLGAPWSRLGAFDANLAANAVSVPGDGERTYSDGQTPATADHAAQIVVTRVGLDGVLVRAVDGLNFYWGGYDSIAAQWFIAQANGGLPANLATAAEGGQPATLTLKLEVDAAQGLTLFAGGVQKLTATGTRTGTSGTGGFRAETSAGTVYDDYVLTDSSGAGGGPPAGLRTLHLTGVGI